MGTCVSSEATRKGEDKPLSAKVVDIEGRLSEFRQAVRAKEVLSGHPNCYLCSADSMLLDSYAPHLPKDDLLQLGQIYFLLPLSKSLTPLSLQDFCDLAIKTSTALHTASQSHAFLHRCRSSTISSHGNYGNNVVTS